MTSRTKRLFLIRHIRWAILWWRYDRWWNEVGCYLGAFPNPADEAYLMAVWDGAA